MRFLRNRIRTIVGDDANFFQAVSRLFHYLFFTNKTGKFFSKIFAKQETKPQNRTKPEFLPVLERPSIQGNPLISIIIPTRNKAQLVKQCINSIIELSTYRNFEIVLIDNRSNEKELSDYIKSLGEREDIHFKSIYADIEFNFSQLINLGVEHSKGELILLLNNDVKVITPDWLECMAAYAQHEQVGAVGIKLLYPDNTIQHAGIVLEKSTIARHIFSGKDGSNTPSAPQNFLAVTAACLMTTRKKFDEVAGFDTIFKVEFNDIDFCLKLFEKGYHNVFLPEVELYHYESASRRHPHSDSKSYKQHLIETKLMREKWGKHIESDPYHIY